MKQDKHTSAQWSSLDPRKLIFCLGKTLGNWIMTKEAIHMVWSWARKSLIAKNVPMLGLNKDLVNKQHIARWWRAEAAVPNHDRIILLFFLYQSSTVCSLKKREDLDSHRQYSYWRTASSSCKERTDLWQILSREVAVERRKRGNGRGGIGADADLG